MANKILRHRRMVPRFPRQESHKRIRLMDKGWRHPKGRHGRVKKLHFSHGYSPKIGYGTPAAFRNMHSSGLGVVEVSNVDELSKINPETQGIKIKSIGNRKKIMVIKAAVERKIRIFNVRNTEEFLKQHEKKPKAAVQETKTHEAKKK
ncbi:MAG: eL32 family ribosomal protein [Candidatus Nanoarchaeia archaeon]|nr:eL32 family ribosomal protein [Candidatus Nanoarchaeia archaeon]MDD5239654.1 eL32 family ribosomal protein [Candidatus Nanoarchaeia archaeon]